MYPTVSQEMLAEESSAPIAFVSSAEKYTPASIRPEPFFTSTESSPSLVTPEFLKEIFRFRSNIKVLSLKASPLTLTTPLTLNSEPPNAFESDSFFKLVISNTTVPFECAAGDTWSQPQRRHPRLTIEARMIDVRMFDTFSAALHYYQAKERARTCARLIFYICNLDTVYKS